MNLTATQIEDIVRVVVQRLRAGVVAPSVPMTPIQTPAPIKTPESSSGDVHLSDRVITLESLQGQLGAKTIVVHPKAVVTPAVKDLLRQQNIRLVRQLPTENAQATRPAPLLLVTNEAQHSAMSKRVCSQQATTIAASNAASAVSAIDQHLANGSSGAVWCSDTPFASVAATFGHASLRAMQLFNLQDLPRAIEQAQPNVLILDCHTWNAPAIMNLVRNWYRSLH
jgi:hypothetical protein